MSGRWRATVNRLRRRLARLLQFRMLFGEVSQGRWLPHTRISPSSCIEHEQRLVLGDHVYIGPFNFLEASAGLTIEAASTSVGRPTSASGRAGSPRRWSSAPGASSARRC